ncbi:signal transducer and activator of transcription B isoform X2 [Frieseomelitta varia]|uniref:signal transducer and activator of transcription B isoform X2 n=1 Tax=Frieseomelitta varia TaxID=561572 RepID=UPI001CB6B645|nr:signal transducer and activator of transcription B isoform X2 [Frieseomelitta varia]
MSPGVNDGPRNTGTLPKSNRRNDRNRERSAANQFAIRSAYHGHTQHSNNLYQLDWKPVSEQEHIRITKNSNTRSISSVPSTSYQDIPEFVSFGGRPYNYSAEEYSHWQKMVPPTDSQTQSPPRLEGTKPSNVDKMPDRSQVESRLNQIRDYIRVTSTLMDSLNQSSDPRAQAQNEKLSRMVEDLHDSERKLTKLLEQYQNHGIFCENSENSREDGEENGDVNREMQLRKKMEESQRKLVQLQEHQASLVGMQLRVRERLNEARQAQQALLQQENQNSIGLALPLPVNVEQLENETAALRGKLAQLQTKKKNMDHLVAELQAAESLSDRGSCSSDGVQGRRSRRSSSRNFGRDKAAELEAMKAQLVHLKSLMEEATKGQCLDSNSDPEPEIDVNGETTANIDGNEDESGTNISFERQSDADETSHEKIRNTGERPSVEEIQAVTRELREQSALLMSTRAELQRIKQPLSAMHSNSTSVFPTSTPPPSLTASINSEKKQSNNNNYEVQSAQERRRQIDDIVRKESSSNRDMGGPSDLNSHRSSSSHVSYTGGSNDQSVDGVSSENLMDIGPQTTAIENGFNGNWWTYPPPPLNQLQHGSTEYYRQLLLGSQAQQLQMMGTTIQQCCQLLWSQQRELQAMRTAINQLQVHLRQTQLQQRNNSENNDEYSNLSRNIHHLGETLDSALPPSSSLPNLVSLPNSSPALSHTGVTSSVNSQHQQQQLNNQVPPGNRANNYWDNFRSYSRQNLLSGSAKTVTDTTSGAIANSTSGNTISSVNTSLMKDKRNRDQGADNISLPSLSGVETQYSSNLQLQANLQQQERENTVMRSNILTNEMSQQQVDNLWEETNSSFRLPSVTNDDNPFQTLSFEMKEVLSSLIAVNKKRPDYLIIILKEIKAISEDHRLRPRLWRSLRALQDTQSSSNPLNETTDQTASESCQSSDEDSETDVILGLRAKHSIAELISSSQAGISSSPISHVPLIDHLDMPGTSLGNSTSTLPLTSSIKPGYNEDLAEADQSRPESSGNQQPPENEEESEQSQGEAAGQTESAQARFDGEGDFESLAAKAEDERNENSSMLF